MADLRYFHGGAPGLNLGDLVLPGHDRFVDGCPTCEARKAGTSPIDPLPAQQGRVYVTTDREYARFYASMFPRGDLYVVEPLGELVASDEDRFPSWTAEAARVRSVYDRYVQLTPKQRRALLKRWTAADMEVVRANAAQQHRTLADVSGRSRTGAEA